MMLSYKIYTWFSGPILSVPPSENLRTVQNNKKHNCTTYRLSVKMAIEGLRWENIDNNTGGTVAAADNNRGAVAAADGD